uniref:Pyrin domain-containing protein n=1 Tax=Maylandia zebra TaxID=106582 RepID=A0A3P9CAN7_9CICH
MARVPELLLGILEEMVDEQLRTFHWYLSSNSRVDGMDRTGTVDLLVQTFGYDGAVAITEDILMRMKLKLWADTLKEDYSKG